jgi:NTE family protein
MNKNIQKNIKDASNDDIKNTLNDIIDTIVNFEDKISFKKYNKIILSGGAIKGFSILGSLQYLHEHQLINNVDKYVGTSVGSAILYLLAIGYTPIEIIVKILTSQFMKKMQLNIFSLTQGYGAYDWNVIDDFIKNLTLDKIGRFISLNELYQDFNKEITFVTYNYSMNRTEYLSRHNHPNLQCLTAIRMSCNLPIIFSQFKYLNCYYLDGGMTNNFAINKIEKNENVIAINTNFQSEINSKDKFKIHEYIYNIICKFVNSEGKKNINNVHQDCDIIDIKKINISSIDFSITTQTKLNMFSNGYQITKDKLLDIIYKNHKSNLKSNRMCINNAT